MSRIGFYKCYSRKNQANVGDGTSHISKVTVQGGFPIKPHFQ